MPANTLPGDVAEAVLPGKQPGPETCRALVRRILASKPFLKANQLRDILLFITERALSDADSVIKEHEIGCDVLGRGPEFNPHEDNIVRVQIGHLRKRLDEYFAGEGINESLRLVVPKGSYLPRFEQRLEQRLAEPVTTTVVPEPVVPASSGPASSAPVPEQEPAVSGIGRRGFAVVLLSIMALTSVAVWQWPLRSPGTKIQKATQLSRAGRFWTALFGAEPASIVVADTCLVMMQDILDTDIPLDEYLGGTYPEQVLNRAATPSLRNALRLIASRQYTSIGDLNTASALMGLGTRYGAAPPRIRYSRHLNIREFKSGNFILIGSRRGIPWVQLFEPQLNFAIEEDKATRSYYILNRHPRTGEPARWSQRKENGNVTETYANLAVLPNLEGSGQVMMLGGLTMDSTEAAGELVTGPGFEQMLASLQPAGSQPRHFELLLRMPVTGGIARSPEIVASRILP